jgi:hypothetical protein
VTDDRHWLRVEVHNTRNKLPPSASTSTISMPSGEAYESGGKFRISDHMFSSLELSTKIFPGLNQRPVTAVCGSASGRPRTEAGGRSLP